MWNRKTERLPAFTQSKQHLQQECCKHPGQNELFISSKSTTQPIWFISTMPPGYGQTKDAEGVNGLSFVRNTVCASTDYKEAEGPSVLTSQHASPLGVSLSQSHKLKEEEKKITWLSTKP